MTTAASTEVPGTTDRIEKRFEVAAPRARVWRAISDSEEFGTWFRMKLDGPFEPGRTVLGTLNVPGYEQVKLEMRIEVVDPESRFAYSWHPYAIEPGIDYSGEPMTLVEFRLEETGSGTAITITESGFDRLPASRRAEAFRMNDSGWTGQSRNLARYVDQ